MANSTNTRRPSARPTLRTPRATASMPSTSNEVVSIILVSNLHCNSCVRTIKDALSSLTPAPLDVDVSVVTQTVTVRHRSALSLQAIQLAIDDAGFDVVTAPSEETTAASPFANGFSTLKTRKHAKHIEQCTQCQAGMKGASTTAHPLQVALSVGGMTCASCSNTITRSLSALPGVSEVAVNLLGNSATVVVDDTTCIDAVVEAIEDAGYEAEVVTVQSTETKCILQETAILWRIYVTRSIRSATMARHAVIIW